MQYFVEKALIFDMNIQCSVVQIHNLVQRYPPVEISVCGPDKKTYSPA